VFHEAVFIPSARRTLIEIFHANYNLTILPTPKTVSLSDWPRLYKAPQLDSCRDPRQTQPQWRENRENGVLPREAARQKARPNDEDRENEKKSLKKNEKSLDK
jgi:hypothetical protein